MGKPPYTRVRKLMRRLGITTCCWCGRDLTNYPKPTIEHVVPRSQGGTWHPSNLEVSCQPCNTERGSKPISPPKREAPRFRGRF